MRINEFKQGLQLTRDLANNESESNEKKNIGLVSQIYFVG